MDVLVRGLRELPLTIGGAVTPAALFAYSLIEVALVEASYVTRLPILQGAAAGGAIGITLCAYRLARVAAAKGT